MNGKRMLSGMRATGRLHLGNYFGALANQVELQDQYESFCFVADWHALTTAYSQGDDIRENAIQVAIDYLAAGLDPERTAIFVQSAIPEHAELHLLFSMITPLGWLERVPSYKDMQAMMTDPARKRRSDPGKPGNVPRVRRSQGTFGRENHCGCGPGLSLGGHRLCGV